MKGGKEDLAFKGKIFNIGYPKTGTSSLNQFLNQLGYQSLHEPHDFREMAVIQGVYKFPEICRCPQIINKNKRWDAITNFGERIYKNLNENYPNSKFILTVRDTDAWYKSIINTIGRYNSTDYMNMPLWWKYIIMDLLDPFDFDEIILKMKYSQHAIDVKKYFETRTNALLILPLESNDKNKLVCEFLQHDIQIYPHLNRSEYT